MRIKNVIINQYSIYSESHSFIGKLFTEIQSVLVRSSTSLLTECQTSTNHVTFETHLKFSTWSLTQTDSIKKSILAFHVMSGHSTPTLQSYPSSALSSLSSLPIASSSTLSLSPSSAMFLFPTLARTSVYFSTAPLTARVSTFHLVPSLTSSLIYKPTLSLVPSPTSPLFVNSNFTITPSPSAGRPRDDAETLLFYNFFHFL